MTNRTNALNLINVPKGARKMTSALKTVVAHMDGVVLSLFVMVGRTLVTCVTITTNAKAIIALRMRWRPTGARIKQK